MTRFGYAVFMGAMSAAFAVYFGFMSDNPHWLTHNPPLGYLAGFTFGWFAWKILRR